MMRRYIESYSIRLQRYWEQYLDISDGEESLFMDEIHVCNICWATIWYSETENIIQFESNCKHKL